MKTRAQTEFGDFQTPDALARRMCQVLALETPRPASIVEPTCGQGSILAAAVRQFPKADVAHGLDINADHLRMAHERCALQTHGPHIQTRQADFFQFDWREFFGFVPEPMLVVGNPPWVTAAELSSIQSGNAPRKSNFQKHQGFDALTGKSNFDIAEWILIHLLECLCERRATLAMLVKTAVARKVMQHAWRVDLGIGNCRMYQFDAMEHFGVAVDACLWTCRMGAGETRKTCRVSSLSDPESITQTIGFHGKTLIADEAAFVELRHLTRLTPDDRYRWRSGVKHDCAKIMEIVPVGRQLVNGYQAPVDIEDTFLYPMMKGSEVANGTAPSRLMLVTQERTGQETDRIAAAAPKTWAYLNRHGAPLDGRASSIYKNRPRFSIFGIGPYTFSPWKVAICSLYKRLTFSVIGPQAGKPVVLDDTSYHLSFDNEEEARAVVGVLNSAMARRFFDAYIFWDAKRAITAELLQRLDIRLLATELGVSLGRPVDEHRPVAKRRLRREAATASLF